MRNFGAAIVTFLILLTASAANAAEIASSEPTKFLQGRYGDSTLPLTVRFHKDRILPADVTGFNVGTRVKFYARNEGEFEAVNSSGWTRSEFTIWIPTKMLARRGYLQVKVRFDGGDSDIFNIPVLPPPAAPPIITRIQPTNFPLSPKSESIYVYGRNVDNYGFSGILLNGKGIFIGNVVLGEGDSGLVIGQIPKEYLVSHGVYSVQLVTRAGKSDPVNICVACVQAMPITLEPEKPPARADSKTSSAVQASPVSVGVFPTRTLSLQSSQPQTTEASSTEQRK